MSAPPQRSVPVSPGDLRPEELRPAAAAAGGGAAAGAARATHVGPVLPSLRRRILSGSAWVFAGKVVASLLGIAVNALLARLLGHGELGVYFIFTSGAMFGSAVAMLGMDRAVVRLVAAALGRGEGAKARAAMATVWRLGALGVLVVGGLLGVALERLYALHDARHLGVDVLLLAVAWVIALGLQTLVAESFRGFQNFKLATVADGLFANVVAVAVLAALWTMHRKLGLAEAMAITACGLGVSALLGGLLLGRRVEKLPRGEEMESREVLRVAWPFVITTAATFLVTTGMDVWILGLVRSTSDVSLYGSAARLVWFVATPLIVVSLVVPPIIAELHARGENRRLEQSMRAIATVSGAPAALILLVFLLAGKPILGLVYGGYYRQGAIVLAILSFARLFAVYTGSSGTALLMTGYQRTMMVITLIAGCSAVAMELGLGWRYGMVGVACGSAAGQFLQNALQLFMTKRKLGIWTHAELNPARLRRLALRGVG